MAANEGAKTLSKGNSARNTKKANANTIKILDELELTTSVTRKIAKCL